MRVSHGEDLGLGLVVVLAFLLLVTVLALVVRKKWMATLARSEEVRRLLAMASEETIRAEMEHAFGYRSEKDLPAVSVGDTDGNGPLRLCAVCYSPTTTRCSRCKAVRYCSGKCQIIHWRQGHKDKCRPPEIQCNPVGDYSDRTTSAANSKSSGGVMENFVTEPTKTHLVDHTPSSFVCSTSAIHKEDDAEVCDLVKKCGSEGNSGPTSDPSLGCATFASGSVCLETSPESIKSHPSSTINTENSSSDASSNSSKSSEELCEVSQRNPSLHEIATSTIPVDRFSSLDELNQQVTVCSTEELACKPVVDPRMSGSCGSTNVTCSSCQDMTSETILSNSGNGDLSRSNSSKEDVGVNLDSKIASHFILSDDAVSSQLNSGSRLNLNGNVSSKTISYSKTKDPYFDAPASAINGKNSSESLLKYRQPKTQAIAVSESIYGGGGNNVSDSKNFNSFSSSTTELTKNSISNGGHALKSVRKVVQQLKSSKPSKFCKIIPPYDLYIKLYNEKVDLQPRGLINCGNSCYANVVLQCLAFTRPLTAYLLQRIHSRTCLKKEWCFTCEFENLVVNMKQGKFPLSPIGILSQIHNLGSSLGHGKQEDAHEFLRYAIDAMQSMCLKESRNPAGQHFVETTFIEIIFGGYLRSRIKCMNCQTTSDRYEKMMDLTVEVHGDGDIRTLDEALARFTAIEILDGENKYKCGRCKSYEKAKKKLSVLEAPNVLTIALKRFQSGKFGKLNKTVQFPDVLNMSKYMCSGSHDKTPVYCLYAVVVHVDIMNAAFSGHYVCYVKSAQNKWYKLDDSTVKPVEPGWVLSKGAYMLLYARTTPRAPRISRNEIPCRPAQGKSRKLPESGPKWRSNNPDCTAVDGSIYYDNSHIPLGQRTSKKVDSSSDSSGLSFSDECSCSTESTRDSTSTDDYSDILFGESCGLNCYSPSRVSGDSDGFITYSPSTHVSSDGWMPDFLGGSDSATDMSSLDEGDTTHHHHQMGGVSYASTSELEWKDHDGRRGWSTQGKERSPFLHSDTTTKPCINLTEPRSSRETNWDTVLHKRRTTRSGAAQTHL